MKKQIKSLLSLFPIVVLSACGGGSDQYITLIDQADKDIQQCGGDGQSKINCINDRIMQLSQDWSALIHNLSRLSESESVNVVNKYQELIKSANTMVASEIEKTIIVPEENNTLENSTTGNEADNPSAPD